MENRAEYLLESFFSNSLTEAEASELKQLAATDPGIAKELAFQQQLAASLQSGTLAGAIQNKALREAATKPFPNGAIKIRMWSRYAAATAAAIALIIVARVIIQPTNLMTVVTENTKEYPNTMPFKSLSDEAARYPVEVIQAFALYDQKKYAEAAQALQTIATAYPEVSDYRFFWGVALVQDEQYAQAKIALEPLVQSPEEKSIPARYYLGLACAGLGDKDCARQNLKAYLDSPEGVTYRKNALAVLEKL